MIEMVMAMKHLSIIEKQALSEFSSQVKQALGNGLVEIRLFGSKSTGKYRDDSDIDVLVIVKKRNEQVLDIISEILLDVELRYNSCISPVVISSDEFLDNQKHQTLFYREVARDGVTV